MQKPFTDKILGVLFDISIQHTSDDLRIIDVAKDELASYVRHHFDDDDFLYLYHPEIVEAIWRRGEQIACIKNYQTDGRHFDVSTALKQIMYVVAGQSIDRRVMIMVSDRFDNENLLEKINRMSNRYGVEFLLFGIRPKVANLADLYRNVFYIDHPNQLKEKMHEVIDGGN